MLVYGVTHYGLGRRYQDFYKRGNPIAFVFCSSPMVTLYSGNDVTLVHRLVTHGYGLAVYFMCGLYSGCTSVFLDDYGTESLLKAIEKYKVRCWSTVEVIFL